MRNTRTRLLALGAALGLALSMTGAALAEAAPARLTVRSPRRNEVLYWGESVPVEIALNRDDPDFDYDSVLGVDAMIEDFSWLQTHCEETDGVCRTGFTVPAGTGGTHHLCALLKVSCQGVSGDYETIGASAYLPFTVRALTPPAALKARAVNGQAVAVTYTKPAFDDGRTRYELWRSTRENAGFRKLTTTAAEQYTDRKLRDGAAYYYKIRAVRSVYGPVSSDFSRTVSVKTPVRVPRAPAGVRAAAGRRRVTVSWKKSALATRYQVYRSLSKGKNYRRVCTVKTLKFTDKKVGKGRRYYYKVRSVRVTPNGTRYSAFTAPRRSGRVR